MIEAAQARSGFTAINKCESPIKQSEHCLLRHLVKEPTMSFYIVSICMILGAALLGAYGISMEYDFAKYPGTSGGYGTLGIPISSAIVVVLGLIIMYLDQRYMMPPWFDILAGILWFAILYLGHMFAEYFGQKAANQRGKQTQMQLVDWLEKDAPEEDVKHSTD